MPRLTRLSDEAFKGRSFDVKKVAIPYAKAGYSYAVIGGLS
jgi:hypothetical protein